MHEDLKGSLCEAVKVKSEMPCRPIMLDILQPWDICQEKLLTKSRTRQRERSVLFKSEMEMQNLEFAQFAFRFNLVQYSLIMFPFLLFERIMYMIYCPIIC